MSRDRTSEGVAERRARLQRDREQRRIELEERERTRSLHARRSEARRNAKPARSQRPTEATLPGTDGAKPARRPAQGRAKPVRRGSQARRPIAGGAVVRARRPLPMRVLRGAFHGVRSFINEVADIFGGMANAASGGARAMGVGSASIPAGVRTRTAPPAGARRTPAEDRAVARRRAHAVRRLRWGATGVAAVALLVGWFTVPALDAFRVTHVEVTGASSLPDLQVRRSVDPLLAHETIYTVDTDRIERRLEKMPFVLDARVERHFPGGISVQIIEYRPLAIGVASRDEGWLVARDGRVLARARAEDWVGRVPVVRLEARHIKPGMRVGSEPALRLLRAVPDNFLGTFEAVHVQGGSLVGVLADRTEVRFGRDRELPVKIAAAQRVIEFWTTDGSDDTAGDLQYVDVSVPASPAVRPR